MKMEQIIQLNNISDIVLHDKREAREEFFINLFEYCNLSCSFCWQDHDSKVGMDRILENAYKVNNVISQRIATDKFDINIMGGELFCDEIEDKLFEDYKEFARIIQRHADALGKDVVFNWVTNLIYDNSERVVDLLETLIAEGMKTNITTSYDPKGRFNPTTRKQFFNNLERDKKYLRTVSMVITRPNIQMILSDTDEDFKYLYENYDVYFDYYSPEKSAEIMAPSDKELLEFFYFLIDNYPKVQPVADWINRTKNGITCRSSNIILPDGSTGKCRSLVAEQEYAKFETPIDTTNNHNMEEAFLERNNCLECEYFQRCGLGCFLHSDFMPRDRLNECVFKLVFDYITKGIKRDELYK